jgi:spore cortex formation protein SpoVR/YcgB (stage V sporulation)
VLDDDRNAELHIAAIHDETGYLKVRRILSEQYNIGSREPNIQVWNVDTRGDRTLTLRHSAHMRRPMAPGTAEVLKHVARLWGFAVRMETADEDGTVHLTAECRNEKRHR